MRILSRYLISQNCLYLGLCLLACLGIYLLIDVFDRLDNFLEENEGLQVIVAYFAYKIPLIVSQVLPVVFLLALIVQLAGMRNSREVTALEAGGVSFARLVIFFLAYALIWSCLQLFFAQFVGVQAERKSEQIWENLGKENQNVHMHISDCWFKEKEVIVHFDWANPLEKKGFGITVYKLSKDFSRMSKVLKGKSFTVQENGWKLHQVELVDLKTYQINYEKEKFLDIEQGLESLRVAGDRESYEQMSVLELDQTIKRLENTGANVEGIATVLHMKLGYAFSILVLTAVALGITRIWKNVFFCVAMGLVCTFLFYSLHVLGGTLGEKGILEPVWAGWLSNLVFGSIAFAFLLWQLGIIKK